MIHEVTAQGATIEEALQNARDALHAPADADVHVELIAQPSKGLLGLFGKKKAEARAYYETPDAPVKKPQEKKQPQPQKKPAEKAAKPADKPQPKKQPQQKAAKKQQPQPQDAPAKEKAAAAEETPKTEIDLETKPGVKAGAACKVSPVFLAARARQETGGGSDAINGVKVLGTRVYNPFNIGAFGGTNPLYNGLLYARTKGWTTQAKAVTGGAAELSKHYINKGQNTIYFQRFNVRNGAGNIGTHQYMTNIHAPYNEAYSTRTSYSKYGILKKPLVFEIPVYNSMPAKTKLP